MDFHGIVLNFLRSCLEMKFSFPILRLVGTPTAAIRRGPAGCGIPPATFFNIMKFNESFLNSFLRRKKSVHIRLIRVIRVQLSGKNGCVRTVAPGT
jgi:hypothetical protein